jgi:hypothetical protein
MRTTSKINTKKEVVAVQGATATTCASVFAGIIFLATVSQPSFAVTFSTPQQVMSDAVMDAEPPQIASSGPNVYIVWHQFPTTSDDQPDIFFSRSTNNGASFRQGKNLSKTAGVFSGDERIAASRRDVFVVWSENTDKIFLRKSTDNGSSFGPAKELSTAPGATLPQVVAFGNTVLVAWQVAIGQGGVNPDIFYTYSSNGGSSFAPEENLSKNDGESEFRDHGLRQVAVSGTKVVVTWRDNTPGEFEIFFAQGD